MSGYPTPPPPPGYPPMMPYGAGPSAPIRPQAVTVIAIIAIIWGSLALLCSMLAVAGNVITTTANIPNDPLRGHSGVRTIETVLSVLGLILAVVQLAGGIGSLKLAPWARQGLIVYAISVIILTLVDFAIRVMYLMPAVQPAPPRNVNAQAYRMGFTFGFWGALILELVLLIWPILILYFMSKPDIKAAYEGSSQRPM